MANKSSHIDQYSVAESINRWLVC